MSRLIIKLVEMRTTFTFNYSFELIDLLRFATAGLGVIVVENVESVLFWCPVQREVVAGLLLYTAGAAFAVCYTVPLIEFSDLFRVL